jgi:Leucine-rich repeat (LRR) protein
MKLFKSLIEANRSREEVKALKINIKEEDFPKELLHFLNLEELYLEGNCRAFPMEALSWDSLKFLSLKWPHFQGDLSEVLTLKSLENLKIIETPLKRILFPLGKVLSPLGSLTIKDCGLEELPLDFSMLWKLHELNLSGNKLSALPPTFTELNNLKRLNLDHNQFKNFPDLVKNMKSLHHLSIDDNLFSEEEKNRIQRLFHIWS